MNYKPEVAEALARIKKRAPSPDSEESWQPPEAREVAQTAVGCFEDGMELFEMGDYTGALPCFVQSVNLEPSNGRYLAYKSRCRHLTATETPDPAGDIGDDLRLAIMVDPEVLEVHLFLGHLYADASHDAEASRCYRLALKIDSKNREARTALQKIINRSPSP